MLLITILITFPGERGIGLDTHTRPSLFAQNDPLKTKLSLCALFAMKQQKKVIPHFIGVLWLQE